MKFNKNSCKLPTAQPRILCGAVNLKEKMKN